MKAYRKVIEREGGIICAQVFYKDGRRVDFKFFNYGFFQSAESAYKKAHDWADAQIDLALTYEVSK